MIRNLFAALSHKVIHWKLTVSAAVSHEELSLTWKNSSGKLANHKFVIGTVDFYTRLNNVRSHFQNSPQFQNGMERKQKISN